MFVSIFFFNTLHALMTTTVKGQLKRKSSFYMYTCSEPKQAPTLCCLRVHWGKGGEGGVWNYSHICSGHDEVPFAVAQHSRPLSGHAHELRCGKPCCTFWNDMRLSLQRQRMHRWAHGWTQHTVGARTHLLHPPNSHTPHTASLHTQST